MDFEIVKDYFQFIKHFDGVTKKVNLNDFLKSCEFVLRLAKCDAETKLILDYIINVGLGGKAAHIVQRRQPETFDDIKFALINNFEDEFKTTMITEFPFKPMEKGVLDILGPLPTSVNGYNFLMIFQDSFSKYSMAFPLRHNNTETIARKFVKHIILKHGLLKWIVTNQGQNFSSSLFKDVRKLFKIDQIQFSTYHPEPNDQRSQRTLRQYLKYLIYNNRDNWDELVSFGCFSFNTTVNENTGYKPHFLLFGKNANVPNLKIENKPLYSFDDYNNKIQQNMQRNNLKQSFAFIGGIGIEIVRE